MAPAPKPPSRWLRERLAALPSAIATWSRSLSGSRLPRAGSRQPGCGAGEAGAARRRSRLPSSSRCHRRGGARLPLPTPGPHPAKPLLITPASTLRRSSAEAVGRQPLPRRRATRDSSARQPPPLRWRRPQPSRTHLRQPRSSPETSCGARWVPTWCLRRSTLTPRPATGLPVAASVARSRPLSREQSLCTWPAPLPLPSFLPRGQLPPRLLSGAPAALAAATTAWLTVTTMSGRGARAPPGRRTAVSVPKLSPVSISYYKM